MTDDLWKEFEEARSQQLGVHILRFKMTGGALAIANLTGNDPDGSTLCVFKSAPDAEEYLHNWLKRPDEWEVFGSDSIVDSIELIRQTSRPNSYVTLNPPLRSEGNYIIVDTETFITSMENTLDTDFEEWDVSEENWDEHVGW
jgi:hypothetical protein